MRYSSDLDASAEACGPRIHTEDGGKEGMKLTATGLVLRRVPALISALR